MEHFTFIVNKSKIKEEYSENICMIKIYLCALVTLLLSTTALVYPQESGKSLSSVDLYEKINSLYQKRDFESILKAKRIIEEKKDEWIKNSQHYALLSNIYSHILYRNWHEGQDKQDYLKSAEEYAGKAIKLGKDEYHGYKAMGNIFLIKGKISESLEMFQKATDLNQEDAELWYFYACASNGKLTDRYSLAGQRIIRTLEIEPAFLWAIEDLVMAFIIENKLNKAENIIKILIKNNPNYPHIPYYEGVLHLRKGQKKLAKEKFDEFIKLNPNVNISKILKKKMYD
ncbi:MAG: hypothetical protein OEZ22_13080 [Spirochaetia bacterium]|nr:hypothetical protein [Spirochaetia bacterium]